MFVITCCSPCSLQSSFFLRFEADGLIVSVYGLFCAAIIGFLKVAKATGWRMHSHRNEPGTPFVPSWIQWLRRDQRILKMAFYFAVFAISCYFLLGALFVEQVPRDVGALAWALLIVLLVLYFSHRHKPFNIVERACATAGICIVPRSSQAGRSRRFRSLSQYPSWQWQ